MARSHVSKRDRLTQTAPNSRARGARSYGLAHKSSALRFLRNGLRAPGGKLPLFDEEGQRIDRGLVQYCVDSGFAETWFVNDLRPDLPVYRITTKGCAALGCRESLAAALTKRS